MTLNLLRIDGSIRRQGSRSSSLADRFVERLGSPSIVQRNVGLEPPRSITDEFRLANHTPSDERTPEQTATLAESELLIEEFLAADAIVVATPMYNFSVGPGLKSWVDNLIRKDRTFRAGPTGIDRLAEGKRMCVIWSAGLSYGSGSPFEQCDHLTGWFRDIFGFIGVDDIQFVRADNLDFASPSDATHSLATAEAVLDQLAATW